MTQDGLGELKSILRTSQDHTGTLKTIHNNSGPFKTTQDHSKTLQDHSGRLNNSLEL